MAITNELERIAEEAYSYFFPLVLMDVTRRVTAAVPAGTRPGFGPPNEFHHMRAFPPGDFREVVRPNFDTLYSTAWLDLTNGPVVVSAPDTRGRYYMLPLLDMWTDVFAVIGSRTTGTGAGRYAVVPPGWTGPIPADVTRIDAPTPGVWIIGRTQTNGPADYAAVHEIQAGYTVAPLGDAPAGGSAAPADPSADLQRLDDLTAAPLDQVTAMSGLDFFTYAVALSARHRPHLTDQPVRARMRRLGIVPGEPLDVAALAPEARDALSNAPSTSLVRMRYFVSTANPIVNGWSMARANTGVYGTNYLLRATIAMIGLGANLPEDAIYPVLLVDESGRAPQGDTPHVLHFEAGEVPPVDAFWSLTMYDAEGFPLPNALERYALGDRDPLTYNADGSLDLYIGAEPPDGGPPENWLPAPPGPLGLTLRLYGPRPEVLDGTWCPPPLR